MAERWTRQRRRSELPAKVLIAANEGITLDSHVESADSTVPEI